MAVLEKKFKKLPPELQAEVIDFVDFLLKKKSKRRKKIGLNWFGGLKEFKDKYTSLELQKKALEWRD